MIDAILLTMGVAVGVVVPSPVMAADTCRARSADILRALQEHDFAAATAHFDERMKAALDAPKLGQVWQQALPQQLGVFDRAAATQVQELEGGIVADTPLHFANGWLVMRVSCDKAGNVSGLFFMPGQAPDDGAASPLAGASGSLEQPLDVSSPFGPLPGTLTVPAGEGPFPAVLLVAGSGPQDRDETIGPNKPFRDLAQGLAAAGIASLRYDKRTHAYGAQIAGTPITIDDEVTDDALTALQVLGRQPHVDPRRLFVLGHSLGALMAPRIGQRAPQLAGLILLAAPASFGLDTVVRQMRYIGHLKGTPATELDKELAPVIKVRDELAHSDPAQPPEGSFFHASGSYWLSLRDYNAVTVARTLHMPMLALQGGGDYQVTPKDDFIQWQNAFAHSARVRLQQYPGLSHLFMPASQPPSPADYAKPGHVDTRVIRDIAAWIRAQPHR